jgi:hypothetical protein
MNSLMKKTLAAMFIATACAVTVYQVKAHTKGIVDDE